jgi:GxxExxY protein
MEFDELSNRVIGCALEVHRELGPGLLESTYEQCLGHELKLNGIGFELQHPLLVKYKGVRRDCGYRVDILVEDKQIISGGVVNRTGYYTPQVLFVSFVVKQSALWESWPSPGCLQLPT